MTFLEKIEKTVKEEPNDKKLGTAIRSLFNEEDVYIYERNPDTNQVYRRRPGTSYESREEVDVDGKSISEQLELFPFKA